METNIERISQAIETMKIKIGAVEKKIGASKGVLSRALSNKTDIQSKWISLFVENYPQIDPYWLLTGKGDMLRTDRHQSINGDNNKVAGNNLSYNETTDLQSLLSIIDKQSTQIDRLLSIIETTNKQKK
jgi:hypothetical protein